MLAPNGFAEMQRAMTEAGRAGILAGIKAAERDAVFQTQMESVARFDYAELANVRTQYEAGLKASQAHDASMRARNEAVIQIRRDAAHDQAQMRDAFKVPPAPSFGAILPPEPVMRYIEPPAFERHDSRVSDLEARVDMLASEVQALKAEKQSLTSRCEAAEGKYEALERAHLELRIRRRAEFLDATDEHKPEHPIIDSQFPDN